MIEQIDKTTFGVDIGGTFVEIGNKDAAKFEPHIMLPRWNGECKFKLLFPSVQVAVPSLIGDKEKLQYRIGDIGLEWYVVPPNGQHDGALEQEITLFSRPPSNEFRLPYEVDGLSLHHQPELTQKEVDEGNIRPDDIVNSIAVYHSTKADYQIGQTNYKCGKAYHIFRGLAIDSNGRKAWVDKFLKDNEIVYVIPYDFWLTARYPIRHALGDTFGHTSAGSSGQSPAEQMRGSVHAGAVGTLDSISGWWKNEDGSAHDLKMAIYKDSDDSLIFGSTDVSIAGGNWNPILKTANANSENLTAINYALVGWCDNNKVILAYDSVGGFPYVWSNAVFNGWPNPASLNNVTGQKYSTYCTYTPGAPPAAGLNQGIIIG